MHGHGLHAERDNVQHGRCNTQQLQRGRLCFRKSDGLCGKGLQRLAEEVQSVHAGREDVQRDCGAVYLQRGRANDEEHAVRGGRWRVRYLDVSG
jgi:hypothetical protein